MHADTRLKTRKQRVRASVSILMDVEVGKTLEDAIDMVGGRAAALEILNDAVIKRTKSDIQFNARHVIAQQFDNVTLR